MKVKTQIPNEQTLLDNLGKIAYTLDKAYLARLADDYRVLPFAAYNKDEDKNERISFKSNIRALQVKRWVYDKDEKIADCFKNVMSVFAGSESSLALVVHRTPVNAEMYFVTKNIGQGRNEDSRNDIELLADSFKGNFPGSEISIVGSKNGDTQKKFNFDKVKSIAALCNVPSEKSKDYICQGIDKLLNGIVPKKEEESYFVVILAEAIPQEVLREILNGYQELATAITPFAGHQFQAGENATETEGEMEALSHSESISHSVTKTHSVNGSISFPLPKNLSGSVGYGYSWGKTDTTSEADAKTKGTNHSISLGTSEATTYTYKSYVVADLIEKLEETIKRINESQSTGLWKCASYVLTQNAKSSKNIANYLRSITQGDESFVEPSFIQEWSYESSNDVTAFEEVQKYLQHFCHPIFKNEKDNILVTPTMNTSTSELSNVFAFPRYSIQGLPVVECARFGREPHSLIELNADVNIGCAYHMHQAEESRNISLDRDALTAHTFITGSTGSGKSNTIYTLLNKLCPERTDKTRFLVIEPAKGEYKSQFDGREDVTVYGTNQSKAPNLLRINPFAFPEDTHVLEHVDRLVEVFNACWPMYAAMPAVLKESIERSYERCGWSLTHSINPGQFPTFSTLLDIIPEVVDRSAYSADTSNDYKGALVTRVRSLTRGIHGQIFGSDIDSAVLFNQNAIIDLSRIGSQETKALIMGVLVLKLQEFRMSEETEPNCGLRHITVLEEAHNLLRRTSDEQSQESSNLQGKSVEMLANAIAEMRTYGEGFIIADQSPGLLDMSVIRNTNTKIIMRLPDEGDRMLVGKAAGLNDSQIVELSRLEVGVAAISQSNWLEPVLCRVEKYEQEKDTAQESDCKKEEPDSTAAKDDPKPQIHDVFLKGVIIKQKSPQSFSEEQIEQIKTWIDSLPAGVQTKRTLRKAINGNIAREELARALYEAVDGRSLLAQCDKVVDEDSIPEMLDKSIIAILDIHKSYARLIRGLVCNYAMSAIESDEHKKAIERYGGVLW